VYSEHAVPLPTGVTLFTSVSPGPPDRALLVVHGGPDWDHTYLRDPLSGLAGDWRLVLPDLRGCGRSTTGLASGQYTPDAVVGDLLALLDHLGIARAAVLGFSYGGLIAQRLLAAAPERVTRLIVASSSVLPVPADAFAGWAGASRARRGRGGGLGRQHAERARPDPGWMGALRRFPVTKNDRPPGPRP